MLFGTIVVDPPWPYRMSPVPTAGSRKTSEESKSFSVSSREKYGSMEISEIAKLPIKEISENKSHLYLWTTPHFVVDAIGICRAWGFDFKTLIAWVKIRNDGTPSGKAGFYYRSAFELVVFGTRGNLRLVEPPLPNVFFTKRISHSRKPDEFYRFVSQKSPPDRIDVFARQHRDGWHCWGNELTDLSLIDFVNRE